MDVSINYFAVLTGAVSNMVLGTLWYGYLFRKPWTAMSGISPEQMEKAKTEGMGKSYALAFAGAFFMSYVLAHALVFAGDYMGSEGVSAGLMVGFWNWLGFVVPVTLSSVLWDGKPWKLWMINCSYYLVSLLVMGVILSLWV